MGSIRYFKSNSIDRVFRKTMTCLLQWTIGARAISFTLLWQFVFAATYAEAAEFNIGLLAWGTQVEATTSFDQRYGPGRLADGSIARDDAWFSKDHATLPQTATFHFARPFSISRVRLVQTQWTDSMYRSKDIEIQMVQKEGTWQTVASVTLSAQPGSVQEVDIKAPPARALRIVVTSSYNSVQTCGLAEVEIFATLPANTLPPYEDASKKIRWKAERGMFSLDFQLEPPARFWAPTDLHKGEGLAEEYTNPQYRVNFSRQSRGEKVHVLGFEITRKDGKPFRINQYKLDCKTSYSGVYKLFMPNTMSQQNYRVDLPFAFQGHTSAVSDTPVVWMQQTDGRNTLSIGLLDQIPTTQISGSTYDQGNGGEAPGIANSYVRVTFDRHWVGAHKTERFRDGLYVNAAPNESWYEALQDYAAAVDEDRGFVPRPMGKYALNSMWHSWYAHADRINDKQIRDDIARAAELGVETIEFDAGWNIPWDSNYALANDGDHLFDTGRFPDPAGLIDTIHEKGMRVILHVGPLLMGPQAKAHARMGDCMLRVNGQPDPNHHLDPRLQKTHDYLLTAWEKMIRDYKIDGLWYDFLEIPLTADPPPAVFAVVEPDLPTAYSRLLKSLYQRALELNPDFVIITRRGPANLNSKLYCTHVWPMDVPQDYNMNRRDVVFMKNYGAGVLTHACCTSWAISESDDNVARQMASITLAGVPSFSVKLAESPASHNAIIKAWLSFYKENKKALMLGTMTPLLPTPPSAALRIEHKDQAFFGLFEAVPGLLELTRPATKITIVNAYSNRLVTRLEGVRGACKIRVYDQLWMLASEEIVEGDSTGLDLNITGPSACFSVVVEPCG